jgi:DNA-binding NarL/FixJ family response regulator
LDGVLNDFSTLDAIQHIRRADPNIKILVLSVSGRLKSTAPLLAAGASMYVSPEIGPEQLFHWIHASESPDERGSAQHAISDHVHRDQEAPRLGGGNLRIVKRKL